MLLSDVCNTCNSIQNNTDLYHIYSLPNYILRNIVPYLDNGCLYNFSLTSHRFLAISEPIWQNRLENRVGSAVAAALKQKRGSWTEALLDLHWPFKSSLKISPSLGTLDISWEDKSKLQLVLKYTKENNTKKLEKTLIDMKSTKILHHLLSRHYDNQPLEIAAIYGNIESARLLLEYGAKDALYDATPDISKASIMEKSALFYAAKNGKVAMVKFLIENGAVPNLNFEEYGFNRPLIPTLINRVENENADILECLLLLINAWKEKEGHKAVCEDEDAKLALRIAVEKGYTNTANLLFGLGIREGLPKEFFVPIVYCTIAKKNLEMIKFLHQRELIDLKSLETACGATLLHTAVALNATEILHYLLAEVKIPTDARNTRGETYEVSGKRALEKNIRRAIFYHLYSRADFFDPASEFRAASLEECLQHNIDLNVPLDGKGRTLLHCAMKKIIRLNGIEIEEEDLINQLLKHGANPHIKDNNGITPLALAHRILAKGDTGHSRYDDMTRLIAHSLIMKMEAIGRMDLIDAMDTIDRIES